MKNCPLLFIAYKNLNYKRKNMKKALKNSNCLEGECSLFNPKEKRCEIRKVNYSSYMEKTLGCF
ncbi:hypothetical protein [Halonatronum saccharophilum]|uniref:hypothetical protein n=1 Tax=Halonatronum saccharophilum TaxID=150060 RepID=UPI0004870B56|nr:hypothetical protein [Halonatronum saccharophilum]